MIKKESAYSLIEMLLVLAILSSLLLITIPMFQHSIHRNDIHQFFEQLEKDLYTSQMTAIHEGIIVRFVFSITDESYYIRHGTTTVIQRPFPKGMRVTRGTLELNNIRFLPTGTVSYAGTIVFYYGNEQYVLVLQLARGRFYIEKL